MDQNPDEPITVLVETTVSKENVSRLAQNRNYSVQVEEIAGEEYRVFLNPLR